MPNRVIYYGPFNNGKREELLEISKTYLSENKGHKFCYILPNGKLLIKYREILFKDNQGAFDVNLFTFDDIISNLLKDKLYKTIDSELKEEIIKNILRKLCENGDIAYYKDVSFMDGFVSSISNIIGEMKRSLISPEKYYENTPSVPFYSEIGLVYEKYQKFLEENELIDVEEGFIKGIELLKSNGDFFESIDFVVIDEFFDFRPQELEVFKEMCKYSMDIYVNIPYERDREFSTVKDTLNILKEMDFEIVHVDKSEKNTFEILGDRLFTENSELLSKNENIKLIKTPNKYLELKRISQEIKCLNKKGIPLNRMAIVLTSPNEYLDTLYRVFREEKIPSSSNEEIRLIDIPLVKELLSIIDIKINNFDKKSTINRVKNSYFNIYFDEDKDKVEFILYKLNYSQIEELKLFLEEEKKKFSKRIESGEEDFIEKYEEVVHLENSIEKIYIEGSSIPEFTSPEKISLSILDIIESYNLRQKILDNYKKTEDYDIFYRDISALARIKEVFVNMSRDISIIYKKIHLKDFYEILLKYLEKETVVISFGNSEGVNILTSATTQGTSYDVVFMTGLVEGKYPNLKGTNFFFKEDNLSIFKNMGLDRNSYYEKLDKECLLFAIGVTRCKKILYLSFPESSIGDEVNIPSMFLDEVLNIFEGEREEEKVDVIKLDMNYIVKEDFDEITTDRELVAHLLYRYYNGEDLKDYFSMLNSRKDGLLEEINEKIECEILRNSKEYNEYSGFINDENIKKDLIQREKNRICSITYFENYGKCPYKFLMEYILELEGMERFMEDFSPLDRGNIYHSVLKSYYEFHKNDFMEATKGLGEFQVEDTLGEIVDRIENILDKSGIDIADKLWRLRIDNMADTILKLVRVDLDRMSNSKYKMLPYEFEVEFGFKEDFSIDIDGEKISLLGKIDRIDKLIDEDKYVLYDYKTSSYGIRKISDMMNGVSFQLPVYIMAEGDKNIIAGGYINISKAEVSIELLKEDEKAVFKKKTGKYILNDEEWNGLMEHIKGEMKEYIQKIYDGDFSINPKECDLYCPYGEICRYRGR
ncbi:MAG: DNA helicase [Sporanaerobacter sp.]|jgi:ATP-dependent helicase/nuclease subunit B|uniref:PD-(D/E)XK nuclease family protein n=1 Tax=Sporanaerobacter sp. TaxID=2010183 RepID=UPI003A102DC8